MEEKDNITMKDIDNLVNTVSSDVVRKNMMEGKDKIIEQRDSMMDSISGDSLEKKFITENLNKFATAKELAAYLKDKEHVDKMFTNPETGEVLDVTLDMPNERKYQFKRELLLYFKTSDENMAKIDAEYDKLDEATKEFQKDVSEASYILADNLLLYIDDMKRRVDNVENIVERNKLKKSIRAVESGFTLDIYSEIYKRYPSAAKHCVDDVTHPEKAIDIGTRYLKKLSSNNVRVNLIPFISDSESGRLAFEKMVLLPEEYQIPDLFVYSLIRFFTMENWNEPSIKQAHATISLNIKKLISNEMDDEVKKNFKAAIVEYLQLFN